MDFELAGGTDVYLVFSGAGSVEGPVELEVTGPRGTLVSGMFGFADMVAAVFDADEFGQQIVGECTTPVGDHLVDVVVECVPRRQHDGFLGGQIAVEADDLENVLRPPGELLPVLAGRAEQRTDDRYRIRPGDVGDELAAARVDDLVDELVDDRVDGVVHPREITIQNEMEDVFVIEKGLDKNDKIVLEGVQQVHDGEKVEFEFREPADSLANLKYHAE